MQSWEGTSSGWSLVQPVVSSSSCVPAIFFSYPILCVSASLRETNPGVFRTSDRQWARATEWTGSYGWMAARSCGISRSCSSRLSLAFLAPWRFNSVSGLRISNRQAAKHAKGEKRGVSPAEAQKRKAGRGLFLGTLWRCCRLPVRSGIGLGSAPSVCLLSSFPPWRPWRLGG